MDIELTLNARYACEGGAITFTSAVYHAGELPLARFNVEHDQEQRHEVEMVVGDVVAIGNTVFVLTAVTSHDAPVRFSIRQLIVRPAQEQALGISFKLCLGAPTALPAGRQVELIAISHHGVVLLLRETNGIKRKHICALGFLREDGLLFEILDEEREAGIVELLVQLEDVANHPVVMNEGAPVSIGVRDVATRADGLQIKLRSAQRYSHDAIGWNFIASIGNGIEYPYISQHKKQSKASANTFMLYARQHTLTMIHATLTPSPLLTLSVSTAKLESF